MRVVMLESSVAECDGRSGMWQNGLVCCRTANRRSGAALIKKVHPDTPRDTIFNQAEDARKIVRQEIWHVIDETSPRN
jgi:hypothetical protein